MLRLFTVLIFPGGFYLGLSRRPDVIIASYTLNVAETALELETDVAKGFH